MNIPEIKLWDAKEKKWVEYFYISENGTLYDSKYGELCTLYNAKYCEKVRFTGLLDINNVPIYEKDFVNRGYSNQHGVFYDTYEVVWRQETCAFELYDGFNGYKRLTKNMIKKYNVEVVGDVFGSEAYFPKRSYNEKINGGNDL